jgi:hypothetical protein
MYIHLNRVSYGVLPSDKYAFFMTFIYIHHTFNIYNLAFQFNIVHLLYFIWYFIFIKLIIIKELGHVISYNLCEERNQCTFEGMLAQPRGVDIHQGGSRCVITCMQVSEYHLVKLCYKALNL